MNKALSVCLFITSLTLAYISYSNFKDKEKIKELEFHNSNYVDLCVEKIKKCNEALEKLDSMLDEATKYKNFCKI